MLFILSTLSDTTLELGIAVVVVFACYLIVKFTAPKKKEDPKKDPDYEDMTIVYFMVGKLRRENVAKNEKAIKPFLLKEYVKYRRDFNLEINQAYVVPNRDKLFDAVVKEYCKE